MSNTKVIEKLMKEKSLKGNPKNFVILSAGRIMTHRNSYNVKLKIAVNSPIVLHRKGLWEYLDESVRKRFWRGNGMRGDL